jgi:hypothetical protein
MLKQEFQAITSVKLMINIGCLLDIPTGQYVVGSQGEHILLGGLGSLTGVVGIGNSFKSTIMHHMMLSAADRIFSVVETSMSTYDTEINIHEYRLKHFASQFDNLVNRDIITEGTWVITDKTVYYANEWYEKLKEFLDFKKTNEKKLTYATPFLDRDGVSRLKYLVPTFTEVDSFSEFETADVAKIQSENELGDSGGNTIHMRQGLAKTRFLMDVPTIMGKNLHFLLLTAQLGKDLAVASGPYSAPPAKKLQHMKQGDKIKGVTDKFFFLMSNCWHVVRAAPLINQGTKGPEYPANPNDNAPGDTDLNVATMVQLRSKSGLSGYTIDIIVSQRDGVLPSLTEFHYLKLSGRYGMDGNDRNYNMMLLPEVKLSRTTVRNKLDNDVKLRRAVNITAELCQMHQFYRYAADSLCTPKEILDFFTAEGIDINMILEKTRGWWAFNDPNPPTNGLLYLSTRDIIEWAKGRYVPYWWDKDTKSIKKDYVV